MKSGFVFGCEAVVLSVVSAFGFEGVESVGACFDELVDDIEAADALVVGALAVEPKDDGDHVVAGCAVVGSDVVHRCSQHAGDCFAGVDGCARKGPWMVVESCEKLAVVVREGGA